LRVVIPTIGSRGDVQPFIALAQGLKRVGHNIIPSETSYLKERDKRSRSEWLNYDPGYPPVSSQGKTPRTLWLCGEITHTDIEEV
jgi:hypothetical protein